ncbi:lactate dehydrogenase [Aerococcus urinaehominis]|uniref:Lactate dehydrogenase n=1 Tax=Aerococcus urinaehominis TaxID=128944 RepID=A0A109RI67_9LACT|nr:lactate dehydrogenase [Aerococcus urinaehominis]
MTEQIPDYYLVDNLTGQRGQASKLAFPENLEDVIDFLAQARQAQCGLITIGAQTGVTAATYPHLGEFLMDMSHMNQIIDYDTQTLTLTVEAGTPLTKIYDFLADKPYFYAPDPGAKNATIGGNAATNAGGMAAIKYGVTRDNIRGLEVVLANGSVLQVGGLNIKNASGYDLKDLFIGSEGTLGIITKLQLKLRPRPKFKQSQLIGFNRLEDLAPVIYEILASNVQPSALEFFSKSGLSHAEKYLGSQLVDINGEQLLLITVDGNQQEAIQADNQTIYQLALDHGAIDSKILDKQEAEQTWRLRDNMMAAIIAKDIVEGLDVVVPINKITETILKLEQLATKKGISNIFFGHAGDGNIHASFMKGNLSDQEWQERLDDFLDELYAEVKSVGGLPSAEHGIGLAKKHHLSETFPSDYMQALRQVKKAFDPDNILNPNKVIDI